jgi:hypothetical protein
VYKQATATLQFRNTFSLFSSNYNHSLKMPSLGKIALEMTTLAKSCSTIEHAEIMKIAEVIICANNSNNEVLHSVMLVVPHSNQDLVTAKTSVGVWRISLINYLF